jgi:hypothetical protein
MEQINPIILTALCAKEQGKSAGYFKQFEVVHY